MNYFVIFCNFFMIFSLFLGLSSKSWLMMWMSMEINLMFFIPCLTLNKSVLESFSSLKYFVFQCLGSIFFILGVLNFFLLSIFGLFLKLGLFPNHFWMFMVSKSLSWKNFFFILTIQKVLPLFFLVFAYNYFHIFYILIFLNSIVANLGSLNQMDLRFLMIFSSMNHMTWMILTSNFNLNMYYMYLLLYIKLNLYMCFMFNNLSLFYFYQLFSKKGLNMNKNLLFMFLIFFSLLGFPPLLGFFMKMMTLFSMVMVFFFLFMFFLLVQNLIISFSYMRVVIFFFMNLSRSMKMNKILFSNFIYFYIFLIFIFFV